MRKCERCATWKPDANFIEDSVDKNRAGLCVQCRNPAFIRMKNTVFVGGPEPILPTSRDVKLILTARAERAMFHSRGAPKIKRPYVKFLTGEIVPKEAGRGRGGAGV